jgi:O-antigen/teichoic acid export membrane protein
MLKAANDAEEDLFASTLKKLRKDTALYLVGAGLLGAGGLLLIPLYTRYLTQTEFGAYALIELSLTIVGAVAQLGFAVSYLKWFADLPSSRHGELLGSGLLVMVTAGVIAGTILSVTVASSSAHGWLHLANRGVPWMLAPLVVAEAVQTLLLSDMRARRAPLKFCAAAAIRLVVMAGLGLWLVGREHLAITGALSARLIGTYAGLLLLMHQTLRRRLSLSLPLVRNMLAYGWPLVWSSLMAMAFDASGRYYLLRLGGLDQVAIYALALKLSNVLQAFVLMPFGTAWMGLCFAIAHKPNAPATYTRILGYALVILAGMAAMIAIIVPVFLPWIAPSTYNPAAKLAPWLLLPHVLRILEYWACIGIYLTHNTRWMALISTCAAALNLVLCRALVATEGPLGVALAWLVALAAIIVVSGLISQRRYPMPVDWRFVAVAACLWLFGLVVSSHLPVRFSLGNATVALAGCLTVSAVLWVFIRSLPNLKSSSSPLQSATEPAIPC